MRHSFCSWMSLARGAAFSLNLHSGVCDLEFRSDRLLRGCENAVVRRAMPSTDARSRALLRVSLPNVASIYLCQSRCSLRRRLRPRRRTIVPPRRLSRARETVIASSRSRKSVRDSSDWPTISLPNSTNTSTVADSAALSLASSRRQNV